VEGSEENRSGRKNKGKYSAEQEERRIERDDFVQNVLTDRQNGGKNSNAEQKESRKG
jgi:hypothetical protein